MNEPYVPTQSKAVLCGLIDAARRNKMRDKIDKDAGLVAPGDASISDLMRTSISAIICGLEANRNDAVLEGLDMLIRAEVVIRQLEEKYDIKVVHEHDCPNRSKPACGNCGEIVCDGMCSEVEF